MLVSGGGSNLQSIIDAIETGKITNCEICLVISSKADAYALTRAEKHNLPALVIERSLYKKNSDFSLALKNELLKVSPDLVVLAGFLSILTDDFIDMFFDKIINVHPALIPSFCGQGFYGLRVHEAALQKGVKITGATVHFVTGEVDGGPIILQKPVNVLPGDTPKTLQKRVMEEAEHIILPQAIQLLCN